MAAVDLRVPNDETPSVRRMRETRTSGGMRGAEETPPLLYRENRLRMPVGLAQRRGGNVGLGTNRCNTSAF